MRILGCYYAPEHHRPGDLDYIGKLQSPFVRILDPDVQEISDVYRRSPGTTILLRYWWLDDGRSESDPHGQLGKLKADPIGTAKRHAAEWKQEIERLEKEAEDRGLLFPARSQLGVSGVNEPNEGVDSSDHVGYAEHEKKIALYTITLADELTPYRIKLAALCLGVGHPSLLDAAGKPDWSRLRVVEDAVRRNGGWIDLHEYWFHTGPQDGFTWYAGRHLHCPINLPILIGEAGVDDFVDIDRWKQEGGNRGWVGHLSPEAYGNQMAWYLEKCDTSVVGVLPFLTDFQDNYWASFDTEAAHPDFLKIRGVAPKGKKLSTSTVTPASRPKKPGVVVAAAGVNVRSGPGTQFPVVRALPFGTQLSYDLEQFGWLRIAEDEWVSKSYIAPSLPPTQPQPETPQSPASSDKHPLGDWLIDRQSVILQIDSKLAHAFFKVESGGITRVPKPVIRFEPHVFRSRVSGPQLGQFNTMFQVRLQPEWNGDGHFFKDPQDGQWKQFHGNQDLEYRAFVQAWGINPKAAYESTSAGAGQIMGFNHAKVGYSSAEEMFRAYGDIQSGQLAQILGFFAFVANTPGLLEAVRTKDFKQMALLYNGSETYAPLLVNAYRQQGGRV